MFLDAGCEVTVYAFQRAYYRVNSFPAGTEVVSLGSVEDGRYWSRVPTLMRGLRTIRQREGARPTQADALYCFGFDCTLLGFLAVRRRLPVVYEIGDLRRLHFERSALGAVFRRAEATVLRRVAAYVVTAPAVLDEYFTKVHPDTTWKGRVIENRLPHNHFRPTTRGQVTRREGARIRIGLIGFLRYAESLYPLVRSVASRAARFELHVFGDGPLRAEVERAASGHPHITYHGPFKNPSGLARIYAGIDLNYVVYDNTDPNVRLALPNKLYESAFFGVPMMVSAETALAERVLSSGMGVAVDPRDETSVGAALDRLDQDRLRALSARARAIPPSELIDDAAAVFGVILRSLESADRGAQPP